MLPLINIPSLKGQKALIADDSQLSQFLLGELLKNCGLVPEFAGNGQDALRMASAESYVIIFLDVYMPVMDGLQCAQLIRGLTNTNANVPIIAVTANQFESDKHLFSTAGVTSTIVKPITQEQIEQLLTSLFSDDSMSKLEPSLDSDNLSQEHSIINLAYLKKTGKDDPVFLVKMLNSFCQTAEKILHSLKEAVQQKDDRTLQDLLHQLKFPLGVVGQSDLVSQITVLEKQIKQEGPASARESCYTKIEGLAPVVQHLITEARKIISTTIL